MKGKKRCEAELSLPLPFSKQEWQTRTVSQITNDERFLRYYTDCIADIHRSGQARSYANLFTMISHIGRLPEFDRRSYGKFIEEARSQTMTPKRLETALEVALGVSGPSEALPTAATAFRFLAVVSDMGKFMVKAVKAGARAEELATRASALAMMAFIVAMNVEYGLVGRDQWSIADEHRA